MFRKCFHLPTQVLEVFILLLFFIFFIFSLAWTTLSVEWSIPFHYVLEGIFFYSYTCIAFFSFPCVTVIHLFLKLLFFSSQGNAFTLLQVFSRESLLYFHFFPFPLCNTIFLASNVMSRSTLKQWTLPFAFGKCSESCIFSSVFILFSFNTVS